MSATPVFFVSSGRSGTQMMEKLFQGFAEVELHHEYLVHLVQPLAVRFYLGLASLDEVVARLGDWHGAAAHYSSATLWGDSSNKLAWLVPALERVFPGARYVHLVRDGRKVVSSFLHKLGDECYDGRSTAILQAHVDDPARHPAPPPEKKYWWNLPRTNDPRAAAFRRYDQFQRICFHWGEVNRVLLRDLVAVPPARRRLYKLEDLTAQPATLRDLLEFLGLRYRDEHFALMQRPHNVSIPEDFPLDDP